MTGRWREGAGCLRDRLGWCLDRFFWKATPDNADRTGVKCKIMKAVTFPEVLDIYDFCTPHLQVSRQADRQGVEREPCLA